MEDAVLNTQKALDTALASLNALAKKDYVPPTTPDIDPETEMPIKGNGTEEYDTEDAYEDGEEAVRLCIEIAQLRLEVEGQPRRAIVNTEKAAEIRARGAIDKVRPERHLSVSPELIKSIEHSVAKPEMMFFVLEEPKE
jgi:hypothetical protein